MPPKRKKAPNPIVVGTVSTRSTRRQSIVNIEIIPKASRVKTITKAAKELPKVPPVKVKEVKPAAVREKGRPRKNKELIQILKDWSDEESSQDSNSQTIDGNEESSSSSHSQYVISVKMHESEQKSSEGDKQSLIDILEGNQSPEQHKTESELPGNIETDFLKAKACEPQNKEYIETEPIGNVECEMSSEIERLNVNDSEIIIKDNSEMIIEDAEDELNEVTIECVTEEIVQEDSPEIIIPENFDECSQGDIKYKSDDSSTNEESNSNLVENSNIDTEIIYEETNIISEAESEAIICEENNLSLLNSVSIEVDSEEVIIEEKKSETEYTSEYIGPRSKDEKLEQLDSEGNSVAENNVIIDENSISMTEPENIINESIENEAPLTNQECYTVEESARTVDCQEAEPVCPNETFIVEQREIKNFRKVELQDPLLLEISTTKLESQQNYDENIKQSENLENIISADGKNIEETIICEDPTIVVKNNVPNDKNEKVKVSEPQYLTLPNEDQIHTQEVDVDVTLDQNILEESHTQIEKTKQVSVTNSYMQSEDAFPEEKMDLVPAENLEKTSRAVSEENLEKKIENLNLVDNENQTADHLSISSTVKVSDEDLCQKTPKPVNNKDVAISQEPNCKNLTYGSKDHTSTKEILLNEDVVMTEKYIFENVTGTISAEAKDQDTAKENLLIEDILIMEKDKSENIVYDSKDEDDVLNEDVIMADDKYDIIAFDGKDKDDCKNESEFNVTGEDKCKSKNHESKNENVLNENVATTEESKGQHENTAHNRKNQESTNKDLLNEDIIMTEENISEDRTNDSKDTDEGDNKIETNTFEDDLISYKKSLENENIRMEEEDKKITVEEGNHLEEKEDKADICKDVIMKEVPEQKDTIKETLNSTSKANERNEEALPESPKNPSKIDEPTEELMRSLQTLIDEDERLEKQMRRRTRSRDAKKETEAIEKETKIPTPAKEEKLEKQTKPNKTKTPKTKEKKPKETKPKEGKLPREPKKKKPAAAIKKTKEKHEKKEKSDKKEKSPKKIDNIDGEEVRRSSRIKSISVVRKSSTGLVRSKSDSGLNESEFSDSNSGNNESEKGTPTASPKPTEKGKGKLTKSRWTRSSENIAASPITDAQQNKNEAPQIVPMALDEKPKIPQKDPEVKQRLKQFVHLKENLYKTDRQTCKEAKKMTCDCFLTGEDIKNGEFGCGDDCLNKLLMIECGSLCPVSDRCTNKRFQKSHFAPVEVFKTEKKGLGLRAAANIPYGEFILEYVGEVLNPEEFDKRAEDYSQDKNIHYYFMSLRADAIIDATMKGNISRFINHSCDPNAETQKWTVNGELRIGFFSTRTILAGEEITFDYRFQRYGKEAQKCYCEAATCRGWLGEQPDDDESEDEDEEEEEIEAEPFVGKDRPPEIKTPEVAAQILDDAKPEVMTEDRQKAKVDVDKQLQEAVTVSVPKTDVKVRSPRKKPRKELFEDIDQLDEEIEMLVTTGLKNQAHTLKLSRLMVRAKEPEQRKKLLRILRRGEGPCRRLFLDYHGLRLMHGYMIDAQHLASNDKKFESLRLEMLQTLAVLPIPNKTMLQDSKVLPTVENWATNKDLTSPADSDSNSPKNEDQNRTPTQDEPAKTEYKTKDPALADQEEEIKFLATKLLEEWANLKEVFRIPKKERIEQMKEHEREANKKFMQSSYAQEQDSSRKNDQRYRTWSRYKIDKETNMRKGMRMEDKDKPSAAFLKISKHERRKLFALQVELREEERRMKQREMWRQHELNCMMIGTDPRFTAPFDPSRGYQYIWNPTIGQWQNYPISSQNQSLFSSQVPNPGLALPNMNIPPPQRMSYGPQMGLTPGISQISINMPGMPGTSASQIPGIPTSVPQLNIPGLPVSLPSNIPSQPPIPTSVPLYQEVKKEEDPSQVKFAGPIPPPAKLPPKWKCAKDKYGRPYYYHIKIRKSQWEPPPLPEEEESNSGSTTSSETSSLSSDSSTENSDSDDDIDDTRLLLEVRKQMEKSSKLTMKTVIPEHVKIEEEEVTPSPEIKKESEDEEEECEVENASRLMEAEMEKPSSIDIRLKEQFDLLKDDRPPPKKKRRIGLCQEIMISPRREEDKKQFKEDLKRYKANKDKLKRQKELILQQTKKQLRENIGVELKKQKEKRARTTVKSRIKEMSDWNSDSAKKIKENFRSSMATTVVGVLNSYRKPDCKEARITNTDDFKHLARKLTHFVMLKEMKHIEKIEDLTCTDNVKAKAREYIKKYMSKFGELYQKRHDEPDFKE